MTPINFSKESLSVFFKLIRFRQHVKNLFIFMPLFFSGELGNVELLLNASIAFFSFSLLASAVYILNDYKDVDEDREHPRKKNRPIASGRIEKNSAILLMIVLFLSGVALSFLLTLQSLGLLFAYAALNLAYSFYLKHIAILDITSIAIGFVLRVFLGGISTGIQLSIWMVIMTFLIAFFVALAKRRDDVLLYLDTGKKMRKVIDGYNINFIDGAMITTSSVVIVTYILYTVSAEVMQRFHSEYVYFTALFVILGIIRYLQITFVETDSGSPTDIVTKDPFLRSVILLWLLSFVFIIYL